MVSACSSATETPSPVNTVILTETPATVWKQYQNGIWQFSIEYPSSWALSENGTDSGFFGEQVFWWAGNYDPRQQNGDNPAVNEITEVRIDGQTAQRIIGHFQGAIGDMGFQQYLKYVIQKGDIYLMFTLHAVNARGVPPDMMAETLPLQKDDVEIFEQMIASLKFSE